jgi:hypothetical protein
LSRWYWEVQLFKNPINLVIMIFGRTGEQCAVTGRYRCFGNFNVQVSVKQGESFPRAGDSLEVFWMLSGRLEEEQAKNSTKRYKNRYHS